MKAYKILNKGRLLWLWSFTFLFFAILLIFPKEARNGGSNGAYLSIQVLIPSLFPFMVLSDYFIRSGLSSRMPKFFTGFAELLFALPREAASVVLLCLIGGYPVGAKGIKTLYEKRLVTKDEAGRMSLFCVASGPGFLVTYLGAVMLRNVSLGYLMLVSQTLVVLILGVLSRVKIRSIRRIEARNERAPLPPLGESLIISVAEGIKASAGMCGLVVLLSAVCEIYLTLINGSPLLTPLAAFLEITTGTKILADGYSPILLSFFTGFGGICVHLQVFMQLKGLKIQKVKFYIFRFLQGWLCALFTYLLMRLFPHTQQVFSTVESTQVSSHSGIAGCFLLIVCSGIFLLCVGNRASRT